MTYYKSSYSVSVGSFCRDGKCGNDLCRDKETSLESDLPAYHDGCDCTYAYYEKNTGTDSVRAVSGLVKRRRINAT